VRRGGFVRQSEKRKVRNDPRFTKGLFTERGGHCLETQKIVLKLRIKSPVSFVKNLERKKKKLPAMHHVIRRHIPAKVCCGSILDQKRKLGGRKKGNEQEKVPGRGSNYSSLLE